LKNNTSKSFRRLFHHFTNFGLTHLLRFLNPLEKIDYSKYLKYQISRDFLYYPSTYDPIAKRYLYYKENDNYSFIIFDGEQQWIINVFPENLVFFYVFNNSKGVYAILGVSTPKARDFKIYFYDMNKNEKTLILRHPYYFQYKIDIILSKYLHIQTKTRKGEWEDLHFDLEKRNFIFESMNRQSHLLYHSNISNEHYLFQQDDIFIFLDGDLYMCKLFVSAEKIKLYATPFYKPITQPLYFEHLMSTQITNFEGEYEIYYRADGFDLEICWPFLCRYNVWFDSATREFEIIPNNQAIASRKFLCFLQGSNLFLEIRFKVLYLKEHSKGREKAILSSLDLEEVISPEDLACYPLSLVSIAQPFSFGIVIEYALHNERIVPFLLDFEQGDIKIIYYSKNKR
jgi:hypothetical protein